MPDSLWVTVNMKYHIYQNRHIFSHAVSIHLIPSDLVPLCTDLPPLWIEHRQLVSWVLRLVAVDVVLLLTWTLVDRPRRVFTIENISSGVGEHQIA